MDIRVIGSGRVREKREMERGGETNTEGEEGAQDLRQSNCRKHPNKQGAGGVLVPVSESHRSQWEQRGL